MIDIVQALDDPNLFGHLLPAEPSWSTMERLPVLKGAFCIPMDEGRDQAVSRRG